MTVEDALFAHSVDKIRDPKIAAAVNLLLTKVVDRQFWIAPSSTSGRHHPRWHNETGGLVRHVVEMLVIAPRVVDMFHDLDSPLDLDMVLAAAALHDSFKGGRPWANTTDHMHHALAADAWSQVSNVVGVPDPVREIVREAIFFHAGKFTPGGWPADARSHTRALHTLDMVFSAKELGVLFQPKELE